MDVFEIVLRELTAVDLPGLIHSEVTDHVILAVMDFWSQSFRAKHQKAQDVKLWQLVADLATEHM